MSLVTMLAIICCCEQAFTSLSQPTASSTSNSSWLQKPGWSACKAKPAYAHLCACVQVAVQIVQAFANVKDVLSNEAECESQLFPNSKQSAPLRYKANDRAKDGVANIRIVTLTGQ